jgi:hypothetical protein
MGEKKIIIEKSKAAEHFKNGIHREDIGSTESHFLHRTGLRKCNAG